MKQKLLILILPFFILSAAWAQTPGFSKETLRFSVKTFDGLNLPAQIILPNADKQNKILLFINGSTPYDEKGNMAAMFTPEGKPAIQQQDFYIRFLDFMPAKGYSLVTMAKRSFVYPSKLPRPSLNDLALDIVFLIQELKNQSLLTSENELYMVGYSEGSVVATKVLGLLKEQPAGCILLGSGSNAFDYHNGTWQDWHKTDIYRKLKNWTDEQIETEYNQWKDIVLNLRQMDEKTFENEYKKNSPHGFGFASWESFYIDKEGSLYYPEANIMNANIPLLICIGENDAAMPEKRAEETYRNLLYKGFDKATYRVIPEEVHQYNKFDVFGIIDSWISSNFSSTHFKININDEKLMLKYQQIQAWKNKFGKLPYLGNTEEARILFEQAKPDWNLEPHDWFSLGVKLIGNGYISESQVAFSRAAVEGSMIESASLVWLGHLNDLNENRQQAISHYKKALQCYPGFPVQHSQWNINLSKEWIESRIEKPFNLEKLNKL
jgi:pimeloyl-ACP methyl ester carboxylesterase